MEKKEQSQATLRRRKMLLVMPGLLIPFLTLGFWALGGGGGTGKGKEDTPAGLNRVLPGARLQEETRGGKLSFYDQATRDSVQRAEWMRHDPYYKAGEKSAEEAGWEAVPGASPWPGPSLNATPLAGSGADPEQKILEKLAHLQKGLASPPAAKEAAGDIPKIPGRAPELTREVDRLENLMEGMKRASAGDPGMDRLETVMDKILDIQHPERVRRRLEPSPDQGNAAGHTFRPGPSGPTESLLIAHRQKEEARSGFYSLAEEGGKAGDPTAIEAVVHGNQTLTDGAVVKLRLTAELPIGSVSIPRGSLVYGRATVSKDRLLIRIHSLRHHSALFPVHLEVYDLDGIAGIYIPGALERDVAKESADRSLGSLELATVDPSLKAKVASASLGAAKNLLSRKVKRVRITVKAGYRVLLQDKNVQP
jgi:hypothetical protein